MTHPIFIHKPAFFCTQMDICLTSEHEYSKNTYKSPPLKTKPKLSAIRHPQYEFSAVSGLLLATTAITLAAIPHISRASEALAVQPVLSAYVREGLANNPGLQSQNAKVEVQQAKLDGLRARYLPSLGLNARASVAEGGRTIDFPAGDLLNPVYATLNQQAVAQGQQPRFPTLENQSIPLLRPTEQDTRLTLSGPIYVPQLNAQVEAQKQASRAESAAQRRLREELERDIQIAYWQTAQAQAQVDILQNSLQTLQENERVNQALYKAGNVTLDAPKRAQAERLDVQVALQKAQSQRQLAQEYLNQLRNANPDAPVQLPGSVDATQKLPLIQTELKSSMKGSNKYSASLSQVDRNIKALQAGQQAAQNSYKPTVVYQVDAGYQGKDYNTGPKTGFAQASVVLNWTLADGGIRSNAVRQAQAEKESAESKRIELIRQLHLARSQARQNLEVSIQSLDARLAQKEAAEESLRISTRKRDAGEITQIEFLSAEQIATRARLGLINTIYQAQVDRAVWQFNNRQLPDIATLEKPKTQSKPTAQLTGGEKP